MADTPLSPANPSPPAGSIGAGGGGTAPPSSATPTPSPPTAAAPEPPPQDWEQRYTELESQYNRYKGLGDPDQVSQAITWARQVASEIQAGRLRYGEPQKPEAAHAPEDPWTGWDDIDDRTRGQRMKDIILRELQTALKPEIDSMKSGIEGWQKNQSGQIQLLMEALELQRQNPDVPLPDLIQDSLKIASMNPQQLMGLALQAKMSPKRQQQLIDQAVNAKLAEMEAEKTRKDVEMLAVRKSPRLLREAGKSPLERKQAEEQGLLEKIRQLGQRSA